MSRMYRTGKNNRGTYKYYGCNRKVVAEIKVGMVGSDGKAVTAEHIALLHEMDDTGVRAKERDEYYPTVSYSTPGKLESLISEDRNGALADWSTDPQTVLYPEDRPVHPYAHLLAKFPGAVARLQPQQQELIYQYYYEQRTQQAIADDAGVSAAAIRNRLTKVKAQLRKMLEE